MAERWNGENIQKKEHRGRRKLQAIEYLGGKCMDCNNIDTRVLEFDHAQEPRMNRKTISSYFSGSWERLQARIDQEKVELVCANCHAIRTWQRLGD